MVKSWKIVFSEQFSILKNLKKFDAMDYFAAISKKQKFSGFLLYISS